MLVPEHQPYSRLMSEVPILKIAEIILRDDLSQTRAFHGIRVPTPFTTSPQTAIIPYAFVI